MKCLLVVAHFFSSTTGNEAEIFQNLPDWLFKGRDVYLFDSMSSAWRNGPSLGFRVVVLTSICLSSPLLRWGCSRLAHHIGCCSAAAHGGAAGQLAAPLVSGSVPAASTQLPSHPSRLPAQGRMAFTEAWRRRRRPVCQGKSLQVMDIYVCPVWVDPFSVSQLPLAARNHARWTFHSGPNQCLTCPSCMIENTCRAHRYAMFLIPVCKTPLTKQPTLARPATKNMQ